MSADTSARSILAAVCGDRVRALQHALYRAAKADPSRRFHALFDKVHRRDVLERVWEDVRRNRGAAGIDRVTLADVEEYGVARLLDELAAELREGRYRPLPARRRRTASRLWRSRLLHHRHRPQRRQDRSRPHRQRRTPRLRHRGPHHRPRHHHLPDQPMTTAGPTPFPSTCAALRRALAQLVAACADTEDPVNLMTLCGTTHVQPE
ncbi:MAG: hypothetical protein JWN52_2501 [Actinomycetia bacterium]|nr:hypothetical protein [Actinomycetes bacterium]